MKRTLLITLAAIVAVVMLYGALTLPAATTVLPIVVMQHAKVLNGQIRIRKAAADAGLQRRLHTMQR